MKKLLLLFAAAGISFSLHAQQSFKMDGTLGAALMFGTVKSYGVSVGIEPKFFFNPQLSAGFRLEGDVLFGGKVEGDTDFDLNTSSRAAILLKGEYYFSQNPTRLFVGLVGGRYTQATIGSGSDGSSSISAGNYFGLAPEFGVTFNNFRLSAMYHIVPGTEIVYLSTGTSEHVSRNFLVIHLGFKMIQAEIKE